VEPGGSESAGVAAAVLRPLQRWRASSAASFALEARLMWRAERQRTNSVRQRCPHSGILAGLIIDSYLPVILTEIYQSSWNPVQRPAIQNWEEGSLWPHRPARVAWRGGSASRQGFGTTLCAGDPRPPLRPFTPSQASLLQSKQYHVHQKLALDPMHSLAAIAAAAGQC
jgi:hypothetical protein